MALERTLRPLLLTIALLAVAFILFFGFVYSTYGIPKFTAQGFRVPSFPSTAYHDNMNYRPNPPLRKGNATLFAQAPPFIHAIMNPGDTTFPRLECPFTTAARYEYLRLSNSSSSTTHKPNYFFALDLHQNINVLPRLLGSIIEAIRFLGPSNCVLSIVEGRSDDGTFEVLSSLSPSLSELGVHYILQTSAIDPRAKGTDRIQALAQLRNLAVHDLSTRPDLYANDTTVIFSNDIAACVDDVLELVHQRKAQGADMTCAMDWTYVGEHPTFYDVWVARGMTGESFFDVPADGSWDYAWNLFWNDAEARARWQGSRPFQVFSCWNGIVAFAAEPLMRGEIKFRSAGEGECYQSEPKLFAKDLWWRGYGKIAVVPSVNVEYSDEAARKIKALKGYTSKHVLGGGGDVKIEWQAKPPEKVKCMPGYANQKFVDWDEGLRRLSEPE